MCDRSDDALSLTDFLEGLEAYVNADTPSCDKVALDAVSEKLEIWGAGYLSMSAQGGISWNVALVGGRGRFCCWGTWTPCSPEALRRSGLSKEQTGSLRAPACWT